MTYKRFLSTLILFILAVVSVFSQDVAGRVSEYAPARTLCFAQRDTLSLYLDFYPATAPLSTASANCAAAVAQPAAPAKCAAASVAQPVAPANCAASVAQPAAPARPEAAAISPAAPKATIIFIFGGGFTSGSRDKESYKPWFRALNEQGYSVVSIDYRLGLKGVRYGMNVKFIKALDHAIEIAVEDLFSATGYLVEHSDELGIDPTRIVVSGSSAGAITSLQAEWEICNGTDRAASLPSGFNYAGVMSFSGAVLSFRGKPAYRKMAPCPQVMFHGTVDKMVPYDKIKVLWACFGGTSTLARRLKKDDANYQVWRFEGNAHEVCTSMMHNLDRELEFLSRNVLSGERYLIDATVVDSTLDIPSWARNSASSLYD